AAPTVRRSFSMSQRCALETPMRSANSVWVISSPILIARRRRPKVNGPPATFSRYRMDALLLLLVVMLIDLFDTHEFDRTFAADDIDRPVRAAQPNRPLTFPDSLQRLIVIALHFPYFFKSDFFDPLDP